jgi:hypothetical protein
MGLHEIKFSVSLQKSSLRNLAYEFNSAPRFPQHPPYPHVAYNRDTTDNRSSIRLRNTGFRKLLLKSLWGQFDFKSSGKNFGSLESSY